MQDNLLIYLDTEFTGLSRNAKLISVGMTVDSAKSESFYSEFNDFSMLHCNNFVKENVIPKLIFNERNVFFQEEERMLLMKGDTTTIKEKLLSWLEKLRAEYDNKNITFVVDVGAYDWLLISELISEVVDGNYQLPEFVNYIPIDISSILYTIGIDPDISRNKLIGREEDDDKHNSLSDSRMNYIIHASIMNRFNYIEEEMKKGRDFINDGK